MDVPHMVTDHFGAILNRNFLTAGCLRAPPPARRLRMKNRFRRIVFTTVK